MTVIAPAPPPRSVPLLLRLHLLFGGTVSLIGWAGVALGLLVGGGLSLSVDLATPLALAGGAQVVDGTLTGVLPTPFSVGGDEDTEGEPVYAYWFSFETGGETHEGTSFTTGQVAAEGDRVSIEVAPDDPDHARVLGMRASPFGAWVLLTLLVPAAFSPMALWGLWRGLRANHLLTHGHVTGALLREKNPTHSTVNNRPVFAYLFAFQDDQGRTRRVTTRTSLTWSVEDDVEEAVVYDPGDPDRAMLVDDLPGHPGIEPGRSFLVEHPVRAVGSLVLPGVTTCTLLGYGAVLFLT